MQNRPKNASVQFNRKLTKIELDRLIKLQTFWRKAIAQKRYKKLLRMKKRKLFAANELLSTQKIYVQSLRFIVEKIMQPCRTIIDNKDQYSTLFGALPGLLNLHKNLLQNLTTVMQNYNHHLTKITEPLLNCLLNKEQFKLLYTNYCSNYGKSDKIVKTLMSDNPIFQNLLSQLGLVSYNSLSFASYLIKPVQRLCKYHLLLDAYLKNTLPDHIDYHSLEEAVTFAEKMVAKTNQDVEQYLFRQKIFQLQQQFPIIFTDFPNFQRKILFQIQDLSAIDLVSEQKTKVRELILFEDGILVIMSLANQNKPYFIKPWLVRQLPNLKYYKNLLQIIDSKNYYTFQFKKLKQKQYFLEKVKKLPTKQNFILVKIMGTQARQSFFSSYTVYIIDVDKGFGQHHTIYPRFKQLVEAQKFLKQKGVVTGAPYLHRQSIYSTLKSKTIEKRKLLIQQFLQRIVNIPQNPIIQQVWNMLNLKICKSCKLVEISVRPHQIKILIPNNSAITIKVNADFDKIKDAKKLVSENLGLVQNSQFQIFEVKNKVRRLMHDDQSLSKIYQQQSSILSSLNPFKDDVNFLFTRHYYLTKEQEYASYKQDFVRTELELAVIKSQILNYSLQEELMITFMCLFALYANLSLSDDAKIATYIKDIGGKQYKIPVAEFRLYFAEVQKMVASEQNQYVTLPFIIIKVMTNSNLYQCTQFDVYNTKSYKEIVKQIPGAQQTMILGVKKTGIMLMTVNNRHIIQSFPLQIVELIEVHPTAIVLKIQTIPISIRLMTSQGYQISILFKHYKRQ